MNVTVLRVYLRIGQLHQCTCQRPLFLDRESTRVIPRRPEQMLIGGFGVLPHTHVLPLVMRKCTSAPRRGTLCGCGFVARISQATNAICLETYVSPGPLLGVPLRGADIARTRKVVLGYQGDPHSYCNSLQRCN